MKTTYKNKLMAISLSLFMSTTWLLACNNSGEGTTDDMDTSSIVETTYPDNNMSTVNSATTGSTAGGTMDMDTATAAKKRADDSINNELKSHGNIQESNLPR